MGCGLHYFIGIVGVMTGMMYAVQTMSAEANRSTSKQELAYTQAITARADKIVGTMGIGDDAKATRVRDLIVNEYRGLREIDDARDAKLKQAEQSPADASGVAAAWIKVANGQANLNRSALHRHFVARLSAELTPEEVEHVKDGMTYRIVPITLNRYLDLLPSLTDEQKREIRANLLEAREYAMDAGSSEEKHAILGRYKGRINNYLSAAGYNLKQAEKDLAGREKSTASKGSRK